MTITVARQAPGLPVGLKLLIVLVVAAGVAGWLEPRLLREPVAVIADLIQRAKLDSGITEVPDLHADIMAIERAPDGALWVVSKYDVVRYPSGRVDAGHRLLGTASWRKHFRGRMGALSTLAVVSNDEAWVGSWYGEVLRYSDGAWSSVSDRQSGPTGRIRAILRADDALYVGGPGLWRYTRDALEPVADFPGQSVRALARDAAGDLVVGTRRGVFARRGEHWEEIWRVSRDDREVNAIFLSRDGELLVATHDGYVVLDAHGRVLYRDLPGRWVTGFAQLADGELWVSTWKSGVHVQVDGAWRRIGYTQGLGDDTLGAVAADGRGRLWLGIYGHGVSVARAATLRRYAAGADARTRIAGARAFPDACAAAAAMLDGPGVSGQVAAEAHGGGLIVFFSGRQVCPKGTGYRRDAATRVVVADATVRFTLEGETSLLPLPARAVGAAPTAAFVDAAGTLWLGFRRQGVFAFDGRRWQAFGRAAGLEGNPVEAIAGDADGNIWIATHPPFDRASGSHRLAGVHRFDGESWTHFRPIDRRVASLDGAPRGLASATANNVRPLADGRVAIATNGGLSIHERGIFTRIGRSTVTGLESNFIEDVVEDPEGRLWMTHALWGHGVTWQSGFLFRNRSTRDGLFHDRISHVAFDDEGNVWMQSSFGEAAVYPVSSLVD